MSSALQPDGRSDTATVRIPVQRDPWVLVDGEQSQHLRWRPGERLEHLFEQQCDRLRWERATDRLCVDTRGADTRGHAVPSTADAWPTAAADPAPSYTTD